jgi:hypothetical protein
MVITSFNPDVSQLEKTYLSLSYNLGVNSIEVKNNQEFSNNVRIQLGEPGMAYTEIVTTGTPGVNGTTIPISATLFAHEADTPVYLLQFDQAKFYRSTTGINGSYSLLQAVNLDVTNANLQTTYNDLTSASNYYYKTSMYNSVTTVESALSDAVPAGGWARNQVGYLIDQIYNELTDANEDNMSRSEIIGYFNEVNDDLLMQVVRPYNFLYTRQAFSRTAGATSLAWPTDSAGNNAMWKFDRMDYNYVDNSTTPVTNNTYTVETVPLSYFRNRWISNENDSTTQSDMVQEMALNEAEQQFDYYPGSLTTSSAVWYLYYWTTFDEIVSEGDFIQTPTPRIYKLYVDYKYYLKRSVTEPSYLQIANNHYQQYVMEKVRYKGQDRRDAGTPRRFENEGWTRKSFRR